MTSHFVAAEVRRFKTPKPEQQHDGLFGVHPLGCLDRSLFQLSLDTLKGGHQTGPARGNLTILRPLLVLAGCFWMLRFGISLEFGAWSLEFSPL